MLVIALARAPTEAGDDAFVEPLLGQINLMIINLSCFLGGHQLYNQLKKLSLPLYLLVILSATDHDPDLIRLTKIFEKVPGIPDLTFNQIYICIYNKLNH